MEEIKKYTLLVDREIYEKFKYIAEKAMRSGNKEMKLVIEHYIKQYEARNGELKTEAAAETETEAEAETAAETETEAEMAAETETKTGEEEEREDEGKEER